MMKFIITSFLFITIPFSNISHPHDEEPFTTYIQEKLIDLGLLEIANGVNAVSYTHLTLPTTGSV